MKKSIESYNNINSNQKKRLKKCAKSLSSNKGRYNMINSLKYIKEKKDFGKPKQKLKRKNNYSNAKLNVINILNDCLNEDYYDDLSYNTFENNYSKNDDKILEIKTKKSRKENKNRISAIKKDGSYIKYYDSDISSSNKFKHTTSIEDKYFINNKKDKKEISEKKKK